jgi:hypothetical protein
MKMGIRQKWLVAGEKYRKEIHIKKKNKREKSRQLNSILQPVFVPPNFKQKELNGKKNFFPTKEKEEIKKQPFPLRCNTIYRSHPFVYPSHTTMTTFPKYKRSRYGTQQELFLYSVPYHAAFPPVPALAANLPASFIEKNAPTPPTQSVPWYPIHDRTSALAVFPTSYEG